MTKTFKLEPHGAKPYHTGVAIPVFSLRSEHDFGVGQFSDLKKFADFAHSADMDLIQILPINDTTTFMNWKDSYPYRAISVYALHPQYLNVNEFRPLLTKKQLADFENEREKLNALSEIDYEAVMTAKNKYVAIAYPKMAKDIFAREEFKTFFEAKQNWLTPYAAFCVLRDKFGSADFENWPEYSKFDETVIENISADTELNEALKKVYFVQYLLYTQLKDASDYCHSLGVALKGDIAIGIAHDSADAWSEPELFNMDQQTGAPPDAFSTTGQNWGFPTYNWDKMKETGYAWWKQRLSEMAECFDAYRLDHILGFFRIWEINQSSVRGLIGHFSPAIAMSPEEIENNYGIPFRSWGGGYRFCDPFIKDWVVEEYAGWELKDEILSTYLFDRGFGNYAFLEKYDTQKKIDALLPDGKVKDVLFALHENVIFIEDHRQPGMYHPRISLMSTSSWREFGGEYRQALERLHNDYFYHRNLNFWKDKAYEKLPAIKDATDMLSCGEDLGMVPDNVPDVMWNLKILRLILERMPSDNAQFVNWLFWAPYLSVVSPSSHDTSTLREWWQEDRGATQRYYNEVMGWFGEAPNEATPSVIENILRRHMDSEAMLAIFPLQDLLALSEELRLENPTKERINQPSNPFHYWRYRSHLSIEELMGAKEWTGKIKEMIAQTNRGKTF